MTLVPTPELFIRSATRDDLAELTELSIGIQSLHTRARPDLFQEPDRTGLRSFMEEKIADECILLVAGVAGHAIGYLMAETLTRPDSPFLRASSSLYVHHLAVAPSWHRRDVGTKLLTEAVSIAKTSGATMVRLDSWAFNSTAHQFFEAEGFAPVNIVFERQIE